MGTKRRPSSGTELLLVVGGQSDPNIGRLVDQVHLRSIPYYFWDTDQSTSRRISWDFASPELDLDQLTLRPSAIFLRHNVFGPTAHSDTAVYETLLAYGLAWPHIQMLNRPVLTSLNNKTYNLRIAQQLGLEIPQTVILADATALAMHPAPRQQIVKPLSGGDLARCIDSIIDDEQWLLSAPPQFVQERLAGENLRVYIIGDQALAFHLSSSHLDYRSDPQVQVRAQPAPERLLDQSRALAKRLQFDFCALDFRCRSGLDEPVFLEVNSSPMFVRFDDVCENRLVDAIWQWHFRLASTQKY